MKLTQRQQQMLKYFQEKKRVSVAELMQLFYLSDMTIRRDLIALEKEGLIERYHGGAVYIHQIGKLLPVEMRKYLNTNEKKKLANIATRFLKNNQLIFIDCSSTTHYIIPYLKKYTDIQVVTNSLKALIELTENGIPVRLCGGEYNHLEMCFLGEDAISYLSKVCVDVAFFSSTGCNKKSKICYTDDIKQTHIFSAIRKNAEKTVLLYTREKLNKRDRFILCSNEEIDELFVLD